MAATGGTDPTDRQLSRLRDELTEERVALPLDGPVGDRLLEEVAYARGPRVHESRVPTYGCVILPAGRGPDDQTAVELLPAGDVEAGLLRRFADGSRVFLVASGDRTLGIACLDRHAGEERTLIDFVRRTGAFVVQRADDGHVSVVTHGGVIVWDGLRWLQKPHADRAVGLISDLLPDGDPDVLRGLMELCLHWLMPARVGATLVWHPNRDSLGLDGLEKVEPLVGVPLTVARQSHLPGLRSAISQTDGAVLVAPDGAILAFGSTLLPSRDAVDEVPPRLGTRHTSAHRFSHDHPGALLIVVSEDGPLSLFHAGQRVDLAIG